MRERNNKPIYPISFERRQEIYGYSGQKYITRNIIFSEYKNSKSSLEDSVNEENNDLNSELETFVCASDEGSCSVEYLIIIIYIFTFINHILIKFLYFIIINYLLL